MNILKSIRTSLPCGSGSAPTSLFNANEAKMIVIKATFMLNVELATKPTKVFEMCL